MSEQISIGLYLFKRLHELGVRGVHGVPVSYPLIINVEFLLIIGILIGNV